MIYSALTIPLAEAAIGIIAMSNHMSVIIVQLLMRKEAWLGN